MLALGVFAEISAWIVEPSKALLDAAYDGILPARFEETNKNIVCFIISMATPLVIYANRLNGHIREKLRAMKSNYLE